MGNKRARDGVDSDDDGDYRLDNMLIDGSQSPPKVTVVDWQSLRLGPPMNDVAYFLGAGLLPADIDPQQVFVKVAHMVCQPGIFGFVMAALTAATPSAVLIHQGDRWLLGW